MDYPSNVKFDRGMAVEVGKVSYTLTLTLRYLTASLRCTNTGVVQPVLDQRIPRDPILNARSVSLVPDLVVVNICHVQVTVNLLSNALKFTDTGSVTVKARCEPFARGQENLISALAVNDEAFSSHAAIATVPLVPSAFPDRASGCARGGAGGGRGLSTVTNACSRTSFLPTPPARKIKIDRGGDRGWKKRVTAFLSNGTEGRDESTKPYFLRSLERREYHNANLAVEVTDTGVGMTPEQMDQLFKQFSQV